MGHLYKDYLMIFVNFVIFVFMICFVFQRKLYFFESNLFEITVPERNLHRRFKLKAADNSEIDLRYIDNNSNIDIYLAFGNVLQEVNYTIINQILKEYKIQCNIFTYIPRGFIDNKGIPSERSISMDLKAIGAFMKERKTVKFAFGFSFGCAFVLKLANHVHFTEIVLSNPFASLRNVVESKLLFNLVSFALVDTWDNVSLIKKIKNTKITIFTSEYDEIVLPINSYKLKQHNEDIIHTIIPRAYHNAIFNLNHYVRSMVVILEKYSK